MGVNVSFEWESSPSEIVNRIISDEVKLYAASEWHKQYSQFVPYEQGTLRGTIDLSTEGNMGIITHEAPYSHAHYVGHHWKTGTPFQWSNPNASAAWDQAAIAAGKASVLAQSIQNYIGR